MNNSPLHDERPWGSFDQFTKNEATTVKIIRVNPGKRLSLQRHAHRAEFWYVLSGNGTAEIDSAEHALTPGVTVEIPVHTTHRLTASDEGITILEIATGEFDEDDIERLEDDYGRVAAS
jgi:mannose-6-phosphate isomerase-like protein (cupin superfamily)